MTWPEVSGGRQGKVLPARPQVGTSGSGDRASRLPSNTPPQCDTKGCNVCFFFNLSSESKNETGLLAANQLYVLFELKILKNSLPSWYNG